jgi:hypothetical protein
MPPKKNLNKNASDNINLNPISVLDEENVSHPFPIEERPETNLSVLPVNDVSDAPRVFRTSTLLSYDCRYLVLQSTKESAMLHHLF